MLPGLLLLILPGCEAANSPGSNASRNGGSQQDSPQEDCEQLLGDTVAMVQPDRLGMTADREMATSMLNQWVTACSPRGEEDVGLPSKTRDLLSGILDSEELDQAARPYFTERAPGHLRNCLLAKRTVEFVGSNAENELQRIVRLFDYVCRNVALVEESESLPLTTFEILLFGRGTAADRAWVFAELLRQLRIDAVILRPSGHDPEGAPGEPDRNWLVGVLLEGEVYLFDPRLGLPIPPAHDDSQPLIRRPATLSEALASGEILGQLDIGPDHPYPLAAEDLREPRVELIGGRSLYLPRMKLLQGALSGDRSVIVYDGMEDTSFGPGLLTRIGESGDGYWSPADIAVWPHAECSAQAFEQIRKERSQKLLVRLRPFDAPIPLGDPSGSPQGGPVDIKPSGPPEREQLTTRVAQLLGDHETALRRYNGIRQHPNFVDRQIRNLEEEVGRRVQAPPEIRQVHARAAEDAHYWSCVCQIEQGHDRIAAARLRAYLNRAGARAWEIPARGLLAMSLVRQGALDEAIRTLQDVPEQHVQWEGYQLLIRRWQNLQSADDGVTEN